MVYYASCSLVGDLAEFIQVLEAVETIEQIR